MGEPEEAPELESSQLESSLAQGYFLAIEATFLELRGAPLYLSPADWQVARGWYEDGIPLELVERTLHDVFERRRRQGTEQKVTSLKMVRRSIESAWKREQKLRAPAMGVAAPTVAVSARLEALAESLPHDLPSREVFAQRIRGLQGGPETVEEKLRILDAEILTLLDDHLEPADRAELDAVLEQAVRNLERRLPAAEVEVGRTRLRERQLREQSGLPLLSLFAVDILPEDPDDGSAEQS